MKDEIMIEEFSENLTPHIESLLREDSLLSGQSGVLIKVGRITENFPDGEFHLVGKSVRFEEEIDAISMAKGVAEFFCAKESRRNYRTKVLRAVIDDLEITRKQLPMSQRLRSYVENCTKKTGEYLIVPLWLHSEFKVRWPFSYALEINELLIVHKDTSSHIEYTIYVSSAVNPGPGKFSVTCSCTIAKNTLEKQQAVLITGIPG